MLALVRPRRWAPAVAGLTALSLGVPAVAATPSPFTDHYVATCPAGRASLSVAGAAVGSRTLGPFVVAVSRRGLEVRSGGRILWSSVAGSPFVGAAAGTPRVTTLAGFSFVRATATRCWRAQRIDAVRRAGATVTVSGTLGRGARYRVAFTRRSPARLAMTVHVTAPGAGAVLLTAASPRRAAVHGFGEMRRWDLRGGVVPIISREAGVGRGQPGVTAAEDRLLPPQGGAYNTTYTAIPEYLTSAERGFFWADAQYGVFDLSRPGAIAAQLWSTTMHAEILRGTTPARLVGAYTQFSGRMRPLPAWVDRGAIVGMEGGTGFVRRHVALLRRAGVPLAGVWLQDWVGERETSFGTRLLWNWTLSTRQYPGWSGLVASLRRAGIRVLTYVNPMLAASGVPPGEPDLYARAAARGYLVRTTTGTPYQLAEGGFNAGLIDLSNPAARRWTISVLHAMARRFGASGWMADFGEQAPVDGVYRHGSGAYWHNHYPAAWAQIQAQATRGTDVVAFERSAAATSPRSARLFWRGDQLVDWSAQDGMRAALTGELSGGLSGMSLNDSDTGGYTTLASPKVTRSPQLLERWSEMNAFSGAMLRTHEGNRPTLDAQVYTSAASARRFARWARVFGALTPYRDGLERIAARTGLPIVRPLWITWPRLGAITSEFTLGADVLVAPAFHPGQTRMRVTLPPGRWREVFGTRRARGGQTVTVASPPGRPAVFTTSARLRALIRRAAGR